MTKLTLNKSNENWQMILFFLFVSQVQYLDQLLVCVDAVLCVCQVDCAVISLQLLKVLVSVQSLASQQDQCSKVKPTH